MKLNNYTPLFIFIFIATIGHAQHTTGTIIDSQTNETIPFATVQIGENYGVITNSEGVFDINTQRFQSTDSLIISFLGYEQKAIALKDYNNETIVLEQATNTLGNVYLLNKNINPLSILDSVRKNIPTNYKGATVKLSVFERNRMTSKPIDIEYAIKKADFIPKSTLKEFNNSFEQLSSATKLRTSNMYRDSFMELYVDGTDSMKLDVKKTTKLFNRAKSGSNEVLQRKAIDLVIDKLKSSNTFKLRSGIIPLEDSLSLKDISTRRTDTLRTSEKKSTLQGILKKYGFGATSDFNFIFEPKKYTYEITGAIDYADEMVYIITFEPDKNSAKYSGEMYVGASSYAVHKLDYQLAPGKTGPSINLKLLLGIKFKETDNSALVLYQKLPDGTYIPKFIKTTSERYTYFDRSLTFIENAPRKDRIKLKLGLLSESNVAEENQLLVLDMNAISKSTYQGFIQPKEQLIETIEKYNPSLWKEYTTIAPDVAIKEFDY